MAAEHWAILTIEQTLTATGYIIVITTNVPCHLYMRWTTTPPHIHHIPVIQRGVAIRSDIRTCFVVWEDNEQEDAGDTLTHTFIKEPWASCETRWFYFHGTINGLASPSTSPIFKKHRPYHAIFYPDTHPETTSVDGIVEEAHYVDPILWTPLRNGPGTDAWPTSVTGKVSFQGSPDIHKWRRIERTIILFDTSSLPDDCVILEAILSVYCTGNLDALDNKPDAMVYSTNPASNINLIPSDYTKFGVIPFCAAPKAYDNWVVGAYNDFILNTAGIAAISKTGVTKLGLRNVNYDVANIEPTGGNYYTRIVFYGSDGPSELRPRLAVTYIIPS